MTSPAPKILTAAFRVALWASLGAGVTAKIDSPGSRLHDHPSLSAQDARREYRDHIELVGVALGLMELESILGERKGRRQAYLEQATPGPT
jgi:hypothetical protein